MTDSFLRDVRVGFRVLVKERSFSALAVTVLALGICGVTTMFSVVNGVMLRGFSFPNSDRLASANFVDPTTRTFFGVNGQISAMDFQELLPAQQSFELMAAYLSGSTVNMTIDGRPQRYTGAYTTEHFFRILGVRPVLGRDFEPADNQPGAPKVAIIGHGVWQRDFGGSPDVVGRVVRMNGKPATIVGVMEPGFAFPTNEELWSPLYSEYPPRPRNDTSGFGAGVLGLLKTGVSVDQASAEFTQLARRFAEAYPDTNKRFNEGEVKRLIDAFTPAPLRGTLWTMLGFCVGVLLIACANVMNMQFARASLRTRELAVRSSLGASRLRIVRQMLTESLLLAGIGAVVGIGLGYGAIAWLTRTVRGLETPPPSWITFDIRPVVLVATVGAMVLAAVASGLLPALASSRANAVAMLRDGGRGGTGRAMRLLTRALVVFQVVVTCVLLIGALLQVQSIMNQQHIDYGYETEGLLSARMGLMDGDYPSAESRRILYDRLLDELPTNPLYAAVSLTTRFRMVFNNNGPIELEGRVYDRPGDRPNANIEQVAPGYFEVMGQKLLEGRPFAAQDVDTRQPVAVVNAAFARKHFGTSSPIGRRFRTALGNSQPGPWRTIVGVVSNVRMLGPFNNPAVDESGFYLPFSATAFGPTPESPVAPQFATVVVRPRGGSVDSLVNTLRRDIARLDPHLPLYFVGTPQSQIDAFVAQNRIIATMFTIFGVVAVVLAAVGIYGVVSFAVNQRTQEFGVRMALGADRRRILSMVVRQNAWHVLVGAAVGLGVALGLGIVAESGLSGILFGVNVRDPLTYGAVLTLIAAVSLLATWLPARRATRVDPMIALRAE